jgi:hypothetical protein
VEGIAAVPAEVAALRTGQDEHVQPGLADDRADRVHAGAAVTPDGGEEAEAGAEMVELLAAGRGEGGLLMSELGPGDHAGRR